MNCPKCDSPITTNTNFCSMCGSALKQPADEKTQTFIPVIADGEKGDGEKNANEATDFEASLTIEKGPGTGSRVLVGGSPITIGRRQDADLLLDDVTVSRKHATVSKQPDGSFLLTDNGSLNGTYVGTDLVDEIELTDGMSFHVGRYLIRFNGGR